MTPPPGWGRRLARTSPVPEADLDRAYWARMRVTSLIPTMKLKCKPIATKRVARIDPLN